MPPRLLLLAAAVLFSTGGVAIKYNDLTAWQVACSRSVLAALRLVVYASGCPPALDAAAIRCGMRVRFDADPVRGVDEIDDRCQRHFPAVDSPDIPAVHQPGALARTRAPKRPRAYGGDGDWHESFFVSTEPAAATAPNPRLGNLLGAGSGISWAIVVAGLRYMGRHDASGSAGITTVLPETCLGSLSPQARRFRFRKFGLAMSFDSVPRSLSDCAGLLVPDESDSACARV